MAFTNDKNQAFKITTVTFNATELKGVVSARVSKIVERTPRFSGSSISPVSNPVTLLSARAEITFADQNSPISHTAAAGNIVVNMVDGADTPNTGSVTIGTMRASGVEHSWGNRGDDNLVTQVFDFEGSSLTYTPTL
jgi:hypothetical protein